MNKMKKWFIGDYLDKTADVFAKARIELVYQYSVFFIILGLAFYGNLIANGLWYHFYIITFACLALIAVPFILKYKQNLTLAGNWFVIQQTIVSTVSVLIQEAKPDMGGPLWTMSFILFILFIFGVKRGFLRLIPFVLVFFFVLITGTLDTPLDLGIPDSQQLPNQPIVTLVPFSLCVYIVIVFIRTNSVAEKQIQEQKTLVVIKNKEITDSIHYAQRIQKSLLPTDKYIDRKIKELKK
jgi:hypothetical protein